MTQALSTTLAAAEVSQLRRCESTIRAGRGAFVAVSAALSEINEKRLYRATHRTFDEYCEQVWSLTRQRVHQMIQAHTVRQQLPENLSTMVDTERAARALGRVPRARRAAVVEQAAANSGTVTARAIEEAAEHVVTTDCEGYPLPDALIPFFNRTKEITNLNSHITYVGRMLKRAAEAQDMMFSEVNVTGLVSDLRSIVLQLSCAIPYAVCYQCQGHPETVHCTACKGRGFISKRLISTVPEELRKVRAKGVKK